MAQKIIITAKQVTTPTDAAYLFFGIDFGNTLGSYLNTGIFFVSGASDLAMGQVKYNQLTTDLLAEDIKGYIDLKFTTASVPFASEVIGNVVTYYLGNNATVDYFSNGSDDFINTDLWSVTREDYTFPDSGGGGSSVIDYEDAIVL